MSCSVSSEPQSIVHQVIRLEQTMAKLITRPVRRRRGLRNARKAKELTDGTSDHSRMSSSLYGSDDGETFYSSCYSKDQLSDDGTFEESLSRPERDQSQPLPITEEEIMTPTARAELVRKEIEKLTVSVLTPQYGHYRTINQNEFFLECMINGEGSAVVHFFDDSHSCSLKIDMLLNDMAKEFPSCKFLRIDGAWTQFVSAKLGITNFPTVLAIRNKVVLGRLEGFDLDEQDDYISEKEIKQWIVQSVPRITEDN